MYYDIWSQRLVIMTDAQREQVENYEEEPVGRGNAGLDGEEAKQPKNKSVEDPYDIYRADDPALSLGPPRVRTMRNKTHCRSAWKNYKPYSAPSFELPHSKLGPFVKGHKHAHVGTSQGKEINIGCTSAEMVFDYAIRTKLQIINKQHGKRTPWHKKAEMVGQMFKLIWELIPCNRNARKEKVIGCPQRIRIKIKTKYIRGKTI